jgi:hypothetical protein
LKAGLSRNALDAMDTQLGQGKELLDSMISERTGTDEMKARAGHHAHTVAAPESLQPTVRVATDAAL